MSTAKKNISAAAGQIIRTQLDYNVCGRTFPRNQIPVLARQPKIARSYGFQMIRTMEIYMGRWTCQWCKRTHFVLTLFRMNKTKNKKHVPCHSTINVLFLILKLTKYLIKLLKFHVNGLSTAVNGENNNHVVLSIINMPMARVLVICETF